MSLTNAGISVLNKKVLKCEKQQCVDGSTKMKGFRIDEAHCGTKLHSGSFSLAAELNLLPPPFLCCVACSVN